MPAIRVWWIWMALVLGIGATLAWRGVELDTRLADLAPTSDRGGAARALAESAERIASSTVRIVLRAPGPDAAQGLAPAQAALETALDEMPDVPRTRSEQREARLIERLAPHRFSLLPQAYGGERPLSDDAIVERAIEALYSPDLALQPLPVQSDPLNLLGAWLEERLPASAAVGEARHRLIEARIVGVHDRAAVQRLQNALQQIGKAFPQVQVLRSGVPFFAAEAADRSRDDIDRISVGSLLGLLLLMLPVFRSFSPLLLPALSIAVGAASGTVLVLLVHGSMHVLTLVFGASLIGIVIDYSVHGFAHRAAQPAPCAPEASGGRARRAPLPAPLVRALSLGLLTSSVGYAALALSSVPQLARVALFSVGGLFGAWLTVLALLPVLGGSRLRWHAGWVEPVVRVLSGVGERLHGAAAGVSRRSRRASSLLLIVPVLAALAFGLLRLQADDDPRRLIDLSPSLIEQSRQVTALANDPDVARRLMVTAGSSDEIWQALGALRGALPDVGMSAIDDWLPSPARMRADRERSANMLASGGAIERVLFEIGEPDPDALLQVLRRELAEDEAAPLQAQDLLADTRLALPPLLLSDPDGVAALALLGPQVQDAELSRLLRERIAQIALPAGVQVELVDAVADTQSALAAQRRSAFVLLSGAVLALACLLGFVYRRLSSLLLMAVPVGAILTTLALLGALGIPLTLFHVMGLFLVLGLGMDHSIFLAELGPEAQRSTRSAIVLSAATSLLSFGLLAASSIAVARFFAQTVFIGSAASLLLSFALLPTLSRVRVAPR